jgi:hypothetical protein
LVGVEDAGVGAGEGDVCGEVAEEAWPAGKQKRGRSSSSRHSNNRRKSNMIQLEVRNRKNGTVQVENNQRNETGRLVPALGAQTPFSSNSPPQNTLHKPHRRRMRHKIHENLVS